MLGLLEEKERKGRGLVSVFGGEDDGEKKKKEGRLRCWFRWGERLRVSVSCCGEEKKKKRLVAGKPGKKTYFVPILSSLHPTV